MVMKKSEPDGDVMVIDNENPSHKFKHSSVRSDWVTPPYIIEKARTVMGTIDLDPASDNKTNTDVVKATAFYDEKANGLSRQWHGKVWLNPPFGTIQWPNADGNLRECSSQKVWLQYALNQFTRKSVQHMIMLFNAATSQNWFQPLYDHMLCFPVGRISFLDPKSYEPMKGNQYASVIACVTRHKRVRTKFYRAFSYLGRVVYAPDTDERWD
jgi:phage N-6-adenine-methyltransferase